MPTPKPRGKFADREPIDPETGKARCVADLNNEPGVRCPRPPIQGGRVCMAHGGRLKTVQKGAKLRLLELVDPAIATLAKEMTQAEKSADRQRAANSILDRAGISRTIAMPDEETVMSALKERLHQVRAGDN